MKKHFKAMQKAGLSLALFALISVIFVATTNRLTASKIAENQAMMLLKALNEIAPKDSYDNDLIASKVILKAKGTGFVRDTPVFLATKNGVPATAIFEVTTLKGYSGAITILIGINAQQKNITGVRVVQHHETPGLGDHMETRKSHWVMDFNGKSLSNPTIEHWRVKKDGGEFDQFTGATITPRAIVNAVKSTLLYAQDNIDALFQINAKSNNNKSSIESPLNQLKQETK
jgi:electron transport complex protein RnfG